MTKSEWLELRYPPVHLPHGVRAAMARQAARISLDAQMMAGVPFSQRHADYPLTDAMLASFDVPQRPVQRSMIRRIAGVLGL